MIKLTRSELEVLSIKQLRAIDIKTVDEERMIQEIIDSKSTGVQHVPVKFNYKQIPDIKNTTQEKEWQDKIDSHNESQKPVAAKIAEAEKSLEVVQSEVAKEIVPEIVPEVITVSHEGEIIKPFCDKCTSKGVRHKKECVLYVPTVKNADINTDTV